MTFDRFHRLLSLAVMLSGLASLFLSGEFGPVVWIPAGVVPIAGLWSARFLNSALVSRIVGSVSVIAGAVALWLALASEDYLYYSIVYAVFLASLKSLLLRRQTDFMQMYALSFLEVMAAAVVNPGLSFGVLILPYLVFLTFALILTNLRKGIEELHTGGTASGSIDVASRIDVALRRKDIVRPGFMTVTALITVAVFAFALVFFFLFPRLGLGFFAQQSRRGMAISGFSETVSLDDFGNIVSDPEVVIRAKIKAGDATPPIRLRGQSLDKYDGKAWHKTTVRRKQMNLDRDGRFRVRHDEPTLNVPGVQIQEVYLEPMIGTPRVLFGMPLPVAFERPANALEALRPGHWRFYRDQAEDVSLTGPDAVSIVYTVFSDPRPWNVAEMSTAGEEYPNWINELYLDLPRLDPRIETLARRVSASGQNAYDRARLVSEHLSREYGYSLDTSHGAVDPLADFLFANREGHCEYFASAMVIMLRTIGIPARIVNGFYGGNRNEYGDYIALRRADAHSWVEVFFPGLGWATFDPTPPSFLDLRSGGGWLRNMSDALDAMKLTWYRWVIEYNIEKQIRAVASIFNLGKQNQDQVFGEGGLNRDDLRAMWRTIRNAPWDRILMWFIAGLSFVVSGVTISIWWRRRRASARLAPDRHPVVLDYRRMKRLMAELGLKKALGETQLEFAVRVGTDHPEIAAPVMELTVRYLEHAFGGIVSGPAGSGPVNNRLSALVLQIRRARNNPGSQMPS